MTPFIKEFTERKLFQPIALFLGTAWALLQAIDFFQNKYGWTPSLFNYFMVLLSGGLLIFIIRLWYATRREEQFFNKRELVLLVVVSITTISACFYIGRISSEKSGHTVVVKRKMPTSANKISNQHFLAGKYFLNLTDNSAQIDSAIYHLEQCVAYDSGFAPGHAMLSQAYTRKMFYTDPGGPWGRKSFEEAETALFQDSTLAYGYFARGFALWSPAHRFPMEDCIHLYKFALQLDPSLDECQNQLALVLAHCGLVEESYDLFDKTIAANPANELAKSNLTRAFYFNLEYPRVFDNFKKIPPKLYNVSYRLSQQALSLLHLNRNEEAKRIIDEVLRGNPNDYSMQSVLAVYEALKGNHKPLDILAAKAEIELDNPKGHFHHAVYDIGTAYAILGKKEEAMKWLIWAVENGFPCYPTFAGDLFLKNMKGFEPYENLVKDLENQREKLRKVYHQ